MSIQKWPYSNLHDLNLDWILEQLKEFHTTLDDFETHFPHVSEKNDGVWSAFTDYQANEIVIFDDTVYIAKKYVPAGIPPTSETYWLLVAALTGDVLDVENRLTALEKNKRYIYPEEFGAVGDGITDDTVALNNWARAIITDPRIPALGGGVYLVTDTIHIWADGEKTVQMNGSTIKNSILNDNDCIIIGELLNAQPFESKVSLIGPGTIDCNNHARTGLRITQYVHNGIFDNLFITKIHQYGIYNEGLELTRHNIFSNIEIWGPFTLQNDITTCGIYLESWDHSLSNITTYSVSRGIYAAGGILVSNFHHWSNVAKYNNKQTYAQTYALRTFRGQLVNLYVDAFIGVLAQENTATIQIHNLHIESAGVDYGGEDRYPWLDEIRAIQMPSAANISVSDLYFAPHGGEKTKLIPVYCTSTTGHIIQQSGLQINDFPRVTSYQLQWYVHPVSEGNNIYIINKPVSLFYRAQNIIKNSGRYLLGYLRDGLSYYSIEAFTLQINNNAFHIRINSATAAAVINAESEGPACNYGRLVIGQSEAINNMQVRPVYIEPGYNNGSLPAWSIMSITPDGFNGVAGLYPITGRDAGSLEESETTSFVLEIPLSRS